MNPWIYLIIAFSAVIVTVYSNNKLQKQLFSMKNKEKSIDLLFNDLQKFKAICMRYWRMDTHNNECALEIKTQYRELNFLMSFLCQKYSLSNQPKIKSLFLELFMESTGDDFDSNKRNSARVNKVRTISMLSSRIALELLKNKI